MRRTKDFKKKEEERKEKKDIISMFWWNIKFIIRKNGIQIEREMNKIKKKE